MVTGIKHNAALDILISMRPHQWTKNAVVPAAFFFAFWDHCRSGSWRAAELLPVIPAFLLFCLISSAVYIINDINDRNADIHHPLKKFRPIAAGRLSLSSAWLAAVLLLVLSFSVSLILPRGYTAAAAAYVVIQAFYSFLLKRIPLLDVVVIASGFVLRAVAGALALNKVTISPWLLICTFLLAFFLGLCKRRQEKISLQEDTTAQRPSLDRYDTRLIDRLIAVSAFATVISYTFYTVWPETAEKFGTRLLSLTIPFVVFGIFRYLHLVYRHDKGDRPEMILLTDLPLIVDILLYGATTLAVLYLAAPA